MPSITGVPLKAKAKNKKSSNTMVDNFMLNSFAVDFSSLLQNIAKQKQKIKIFQQKSPMHRLFPQKA